MVSISNLVFIVVLYKLVKFTLPKIWPPSNKIVQVPPLDHSTRTSSSRSYSYDVFLSFRGEGTPKTFVDLLYSSLVDQEVSTYKRDHTLPQDESINPSHFTAIEESRIAVVVLSKNYVDSLSCLEELAHIMRCREERELFVIPIFYDMDPLEAREQTRDFGKALAKQEVRNTTKAESWRKSLVSISNIAGWEPKSIVNREAYFINHIVDAILDRLFTMYSDVDEDPVGMIDRLQDLKSKLDIRSNGVRMVGIWGKGGGGKTTLLRSLYQETSSDFDGHHFVENIRHISENSGLKKLQENILSAFSGTKVKVHNVEEGKHKIKSTLSGRKVLIILDDVDNIDHLEALAGSLNWFGSGSRIIITTTDKSLLTTHNVDKISRVKLLSDHEAMELFTRHAYNEKDPIEDYETLSPNVVSYAAGLPLTLKVLGSLLYDKDKVGWISVMDKLKDTTDHNIMIKVLELSYESLQTHVKELFLDIACFWRWRSTNDAMEIFEAFGFNPIIGLRVLSKKSLIAIVDGKFVMHDLVQEMGHVIVRGKHPNNPKEHSRVWKDEEITSMCLGDVTMENYKIEAIKYYGHDHSSQFYKIVSNMKRLRWLCVTLDDDGDEDVEGPDFLSNELQCICWEKYPKSPFPDSFKATKLVVLKLSKCSQKELWKGFKYLPQLKVLHLEEMKKLLSTPDFEGLPRLRKLTLSYCDDLEEIHSSLGYHMSVEYITISRCRKLKLFPTIFQMGELKALKIEFCPAILKSPEIRADMDLSYCTKLLYLPELPSNLSTLKADYCNSLRIIGDFHKNCKWLCQISLIGGSIITNGDILLQSMLQGMAIENHSMHLQLQGLEVAKGFKPRLHFGSRFTLQLPENWCNNFCGFLMCAIWSSTPCMSPSVQISMRQVLDFQHDVRWEEIGDSNKTTLVWYVSFASLKDTSRWDQTYKSVSFDIEDKFKECSGFGVRLVGKRSKSDVTET